MIIDKILEEIVKCRNRQLTVFCGAGISFNSGLPIVITALNKILDSLGILSEDKIQLIGTNGELSYPFETFMEVFLENSEVDNLFNIFEAEFPNRNHHLIAQLAKLGVIRDIYTTNFDQLMEKSLIRLNLNPMNHFKVFYKDTDFDPQYYDTNGGLIRIFKIHGSIHNVNSVRATLKAVSSKTQSIRRQQLVNRIFTSSLYGTVVFLGYSCSDYFDIIPEIEKIEDSKVKIILIEHDSNRTNKTQCKVENIQQRAKNNPFKNYKGFRVKVNTDSFMGWLAKKFGIEISFLEIEKPLWEKHVDQWKSTFRTQHMNLTILGQLFYKIPRYDLALNYYKRALDINITNKDIQGQGKMFNNIGLIYQDRLEFDKAILYYKRALKLFRKIGHVKDIAAAYSNLGFAYAYKDWQESLRCSEKAIEYSRKGEYKFIEANATNNIGLMYKNKKDYDRALTYYLKALEFDKDTGDKLGESITLTNIGTILRYKGDFAEALSYYKNALEMSKMLGYKLGETHVLHNLALLYRDKEEPNTSLKYMNQAELLKERFNFGMITSDE
jgi:tetratricopeptide (TPR) repeat protein/NAD-dependent SIR2 family protein deacetylase